MEIWVLKEAKEEGRGYWKEQGRNEEDHGREWRYWLI